MSDSAFHELQVEADGFDIRYLEAGAGEPLIYLHGGGGLHVSPALELLSRRFRVLAFELPGFGRSPENTRTESLEALGETMAQAVEAVGVERYALLGTSFGASTALRIALAHEERLSALVLESPSAFRPDDFDPRALSPAQLEQALFVFPERRSPQEPPEIVGKQLALLGALMGPNRNPELEARISELRLPVLVLFGTRDGLISPRMGSLYKRLIVNCSLTFVYDAAHEMQFDRPEAFADIVSDFVEREEAFVVAVRSQQQLP